MAKQNQSGFSLLEVMVAGSVALLVVGGLFTAVKMARDQTSQMDKKVDERQLLSDLKYVLANPVLCKGTVDLARQDLRKGEDFKVTLPGGTELRSGVTLKDYGMRLESLRVADSVMFTEVKKWEPEQGCAAFEKWEYVAGKFPRVIPTNPMIPSCRTKLLQRIQTYYVDIEAQITPLKKGGVPFRKEKLARLTVIKRFEEGEKVNTCQAVSVVRVETNNVTPPEFKFRSEALPNPDSNLAAFMAAADPYGPNPAGAGKSNGLLQAIKEVFKGGGGNGLSAVGKNMQKGATGGGENYDPYSDSNRRFNSRTWAPHERMTGIGTGSGGGDGGKTAEQEALENAEKWDARDDYANHMASIRGMGGSGGSSGSDAAAAVGGRTSSPEADGACALNMSVAEAVEKGVPLVQHGKTFKMPVGDCTVKKYLCWDGRLSDLGGPPEKVACGSDPNGMDGAELARQASAKEKKVLMDDCAVNRTLADAKRLRLPTYKTGERVSMPAGECLEKSYVCFDGSLRDEGLPATQVKGCSGKDIAAAK